MPGQGLQHLPMNRIPEKWDPVWFAQFCREVLALADIRNAIGDGVEITGQPNDVATLAVSQDIQDLLQQTFVLAQPSGFLQFERTLAGEPGVVQILDGGADSNIEVTLINNGVNLGKLQQLSGYGLLGNPVNAISNVQNISPENDGQALHVLAGVIEWTNTPTWGFDHTWLDNAAVRLGTDGDLNIEHSGTAAFIENATGVLTIDSENGIDILATAGVMNFTASGTVTIESTAGDIDLVAAQSFRASTPGNSVEIDVDGALLIDGDSGTDGQVPTSRGPGLPFEWDDAAGGSAGLWEFVAESIVSGAAATNLDVTGLDLDADECYFVQATLAGAAAGAATLNIFFNSDTTAANYERDLNGTAADNSAIGGLDNGAPGMWNGYLRRCPVTNRVMWTAQGGRIITTAAIAYSSVVIWDTAANLTALRFNSSVASQIAIGSAVRVWRLKRTPASAVHFNTKTQFYDYNDMVRITGGYVSATSVGGTVTETGFAGHPGVVRISTGSTTATSNGILKSSAPLTGDALLFVGGGELVFEAVVRIPTLLAGGNTGQFRIGFMDEISGAPANGIHAQYDETTGVWRLLARNAGANSSVNGPTTVPANTWTRIRIVVDGSGASAELFVDGVSQGSLNTNIPSAGFTYGAQVQKTAGSTAAVMDVDLIEVGQVFSPARV